MRATTGNLLVLAAVLSLGGCNLTTTDADTGATRTIVMETTKGTLKAELYVQYAPATSQNFIDLSRAGFYSGLTFHRYEPGFIIQGGDPNGDGTGGAETHIPLETSWRLTHVTGALGMARGSALNSASSQFYITLAPAHQLDGNYAVFGKVVEGMDVVQSLRQGDQILRITVP